MNLTRVVFKSHKWLAVGAGFLSFLWFSSGVFMTIPQRLLKAFAETTTRAEGPSPGYRESTISLAEAISRLDQEARKPVEVTRVEFRILEGQPYYRISTPTGNYLVSGRDTSILAISDEVARRLVVYGGARADLLGTTTLLRSYNADYPWGSLPVWRIEAQDARRTVYYVAVESGEVRSTHRWGRILSFLTGLHTLDFLNPYLSRGRIRFIMWVFSIAGTIMTLFGFWILCIQFQNWRHRRIS